MSRQEQIERIRDIIQQADDKYGDEQTWFYHQKLAEMLTDAGIGDKDRFEIYYHDFDTKKREFNNIIKPIEYKEEG